MSKSAANFTNAPSPIQSNSSTLQGLTNVDVRSHYSHLTLLRNIRIGLSTFTLVAAIVILGFSGNNLNVFIHTYLPGEWLLPLWPIGFDIQPTKGLLGSAAVIAFFS